MTSGSGAGDGLRRIDHVAVAVLDADTAMKYYIANLGLQLAHDERLPDIGVRLAYLTTDGDIGEQATLQLVQPIDQGPIADFIASRGEALHHVCFAVQDISRTLAAVPGEADSAVFLGGRHRRCAFLSHEPNGMRVELTEEHEHDAVPYESPGWLV